MAAPMYANPNETPMIVQPGLQAREVQILPQPASISNAAVQPQMPGFAPAAPSTLDQDMAQDQRIRRRVVFISAIIAIYVVINAVLQYVFDVATLEDTLEKVREVTHFKGGPTMTKLLLNAIPSVGMSITIGLLVPLCGYLGVKQNQQALVGCFCGCNFFHCCCGILSVAGLIVFMLGTQAMAPGVEHYMAGCDPMQCVPRVNQSEKAVLEAKDFFFDSNRETIVDCLAAGTWEDYKPKLSKHSYHLGCPKIFLRCGHEREEPEDSFSEPPEPTEVVDAEGFTDLDPPTAGAANSALGSGRRLWAVLQEQSFTRRLRSVWTEAAVTPQDPAGQSRSRAFPWLRGVRTHPAPNAHLYQRHKMEPPPRPHDVLAECSPARLAMKRFHQIRLLVPELLPQLTLFIFVRIVLILPVVCLGCLGFWWGKDLWHRLHQGYTQVSLQSTTRPQQVMMQPTQGFAMAGAQTLTAPTSAQPLLLHVPPAPPVAQSEQQQSLLQNAASNDAAPGVYIASGTAA
mmetsp:Transcript_142902/g.252292  ORF Transcript_142902/g.252292 Transcript_142902/m.252292 type:complete len:513 (+) Transcript_142902:63-1601(+)